MRMTWLVLVLGCAGTAAKPAPAPQGSAASAPTPLQHDLAIFCGKDMQEHGTDPKSWGPWLEPQMTSPEMKARLAGLKNGTTTPAQFIDGIRADMNTAGIASCPELAALERPAQ
jgi:hypothetical protein